MYQTNCIMWMTVFVFNIKAQGAGAAKGFNKGSETLKIPVYTLIPRHPDIQLQKQALLMKQ